MFIHGGPGGGCGKRDRCFFNPATYSGRIPLILKTNFDLIQKLYCLIKEVLAAQNREYSTNDDTIRSQVDVRLTELHRWTRTPPGIWLRILKDYESILILINGMSSEDLG